MTHPWPAPLTSKEEAEMRDDLDPYDAYQYGGWANLVGRLFATLDAARVACGQPSSNADKVRLGKQVNR
jgi:hypothetical protein